MSGRLVCPLLGFPNEQIITGAAYKFYACQPVPDRPELVIAVWNNDLGGDFLVCLFEAPDFPKHDSLTVGDNSIGEPRRADGALHAQSLIFHILEHLPTEVTNEQA